jgi:EAL domain-containing protein (putative c-di-GMP-specific phosphodiesterase class I)
LANAKGLPGGRTLFINLSIHGLEYLETEGGGLARVVDRIGWPATDFVLEITERTYAESPERLQSRADELRGHGFRIAIDDMGTGFSSLNVLAELEPEYIKLDRTLVRDLATKPIKRNLVKAITGFAQTSRSVVIAEGVEQKDEVDVLEDLGIDLVQGYYFGVPAPAPA